MKKNLFSHTNASLASFIDKQFNKKETVLRHPGLKLAEYVLTNKWKFNKGVVEIDTGTLGLHRFSLSNITLQSHPTNMITFPSLLHSIPFVIPKDKKVETSPGCVRVIPFGVLPKKKKLINKQKKIIIIIASYHLQSSQWR